MSAVYALGRNPFPSAVEKLVSLLETDDNAYVRRATAWSLANYDNEICLLYTSPSPRDKRQSRMPSSA